MDEKLPGLDLAVVAAAVDGDADANGHGIPPIRGNLVSPITRCVPAHRRPGENT
jgi:hypothetical protein